MTPNGTYLFMLTGADPALEAVFTRNDALTGWRCLTVTTAEAALAELGTHDGLVLDLIVLCGDRFLPLLAEIRAQRPLLPVIMQADERAAALRALRHGANDAVLGPQSTAHWKRLIASYARMLAPAPELRPLSLPLPMPESFDEIAGCNSGFRSAVAIAAKAARSRIPLLLSGESGTGKHMLARAIHHSGARGARAFVHFDPRNYSAEEAEITLFGDPYRFYGNRIERHGLISAAEGGTLFIHPVEDLPSAVQPQLLRLIEHGLVRQRGSRTTRHCDVRIISAGADEFDPKHRADIWREDLYYALASVRIALPPLRERREDIVQIAQDILTIVLPRLGLSACQLGKRARVLLTAYDWPGNVRQLQSVLLRAVLRSEKETLDLDDFEALVTVMPAIHSHQPDARTMQNGGILLFDEAGHIRPLEHIEADIIHLAISHYRGRMSEVARRLGIGRATLYRRLADLDQSGSI